MKYWVYLNHEIPGSYTPEELVKLSGFTITTLLCPAEGRIIEKNWRRAGEFQEVVKTFSARETKLPTQSSKEIESFSAASSTAQTLFELLKNDKAVDLASSKLFNQISNLIEELGHRREEKILTSDTLKQMQDLKEELSLTQQRSDLLEMRLKRLAELEELELRHRAEIEQLKSQIMARDISAS